MLTIIEQRDDAVELQGLQAGDELMLRAGSKTALRRLRAAIRSAAQDLHITLRWEDGEHRTVRGNLTTVRGEVLAEGVSLSRGHYAYARVVARLTHFEDLPTVEQQLQDTAPDYLRALCA